MKTLGRDRLFQTGDHELRIERFLLGKPCCIDGLEASEESLLLRDGCARGGGGVIAPPIVPALFTEDRGKFGSGAERPFPVLVEERVELLDAGRDGKLLRV